MSAAIRTSASDCAAARLWPWRISRCCGIRARSFLRARGIVAMQGLISRWAVVPAGVVTLLAAFALAGPASADEPGAPPPDYSRSSAWLCRPGQEEICTSDLDAMVVGPDGNKTPQKFIAAADPPIDCFYVYP